MQGQRGGNDEEKDDGWDQEDSASGTPGPEEVSRGRIDRDGREGIQVVDDEGGFTQHTQPFPSFTLPYSNGGFPTQTRTFELPSLVQQV